MDCPFGDLYINLANILRRKQNGKKYYERATFFIHWV